MENQTHSIGPSTESIQITKEDLVEAAEQEENVRRNEEQERLTQRLIKVRALANRYAQENEQLKNLVAQLQRDLEGPVPDES